MPICRIAWSSWRIGRAISTANTMASAMAIATVASASQQPLLAVPRAAVSCRRSIAALRQRVGSRSASPARRRRAAHSPSASSAAVCRRPSGETSSRMQRASRSSPSRSSAATMVALEAGAARAGASSRGSPGAAGCSRRRSAASSRIRYCRTRRSSVAVCSNSSRDVRAARRRLQHLLAGFATRAGRARESSSASAYSSGRLTRRKPSRMNLRNERG